MVAPQNHGWLENDRDECSENTGNSRTALPALAPIRSRVMADDELGKCSRGRISISRAGMRTVSFVRGMPAACGQFQDLTGVLRVCWFASAYPRGPLGQPTLTRLH